MADTTMLTFEHLKKMGERASKAHSEIEKNAAYGRGVDSANSAIKSGVAINLLDEGRVFMSDLDFAETAGWNSRVFSEENKLLLSKLNQ
jgi:hypothetical protein